MVESRAGARFGHTVLVGGAGAALAVAGATQTWARAATDTLPRREAAVTGADAAPLTLALGLVLLATWGVVLVVGRRGRRVTAAVALVAALGLLAAIVSVGPRLSGLAAAALSGPTTGGEVTVWPWVSGAGTLLCVAALLITLRRAGRWPEMGARYDAPSARARGTGPADPARVPDSDRAAGQDTSRDLWRSLDEGRDPTL